jgi:hypothetical protein
MGKGAGYLGRRVGWLFGNLKWLAFNVDFFTEVRILACLTRHFPPSVPPTEVAKDLSSVTSCGLCRSATRLAGRGGWHLTMQAFVLVQNGVLSTFTLLFQALSRLQITDRGH